MSQSPEQFDIFLSHGTPDKEWVREFNKALQTEGLSVFLDEQDIEASENHVVVLNEALGRSRFLALVLTPGSAERHWVQREWTSFLAMYGPKGRIFPVLLKELEKKDIQPLLAPLQWIDAQDQDAERAAKLLAQRIARLDELQESDTRRLTFAQDLIFDLSTIGEGDERSINVQSSDGQQRPVPVPWLTNDELKKALNRFDKLLRKPDLDDFERGEIGKSAGVIGDALRSLLFGEDSTRLEEATHPGRPTPKITIRSGADEEVLLGLPWELIRLDGRFLVKEGMLDLVRTVREDNLKEDRPVIPEPTIPLKLVVHVAAPEGGKLDYEGESYRIVKALAGRCPTETTDLGTLDDLIGKVKVAQRLAPEEKELVEDKKTSPVGIHFSGHGAPGVLVFEDDEGRQAPVSVQDLVTSLKAKTDAKELPGFVYLASCYGQESGRLVGENGQEQTALEAVAIGLHKSGVPQVLGYTGPILDVKSTLAEEKLYQAIADGYPTGFGVRQARLALAEPLAVATGELVHRDAGTREAEKDPAPFAWAQLVIYHHGPDRPLSPTPKQLGQRPSGEILPERGYRDLGRFKILEEGFIGRRTERHKLRRMTREGHRSIVLQGLGGLGKSTLALQALKLMGPAESWLILWGDQAEKATEGDDPIAAELLGQLLHFCRERFRLEWEGVTHAVDRQVEPDPSQQFLAYLSVLVQNVEQLVVYVDNLESLMIGPEEAKDAEFAAWKTEGLAFIWRGLDQLARQSAGKLQLLASCRYEHEDFGEALLPVNVMPAADLFRMVGWFPALRRLSIPSRARLVNQLEGHPRAVQFADELLAEALKRHARRRGPWQGIDSKDETERQREWTTLMEPVLPQVDDRIRDDLLFDALWDQVFDPPAHRMLYRMTLLRQPWDWELMLQLGDPAAPEAEVEALADRLRQSSLLESVDLIIKQSKAELPKPIRHFTIHPATSRYIVTRHGDDEALRRVAHERIGTFLEAKAKHSPYIDVDIEAGHHLFEAGAYERAITLLDAASDWLQDRGRVREGLRLIEPFLDPDHAHAIPEAIQASAAFRRGNALIHLGDAVGAIRDWEASLAHYRAAGNRQGQGNALGNLGIAYSRLGEVTKAIDYYEQYLSLAREIGYRRGEGKALGSLGIAYDSLGEVTKAIDYYEQALVISREIGDRQGEGSFLGNLGSAYARLGEVTKAIDYYEQALKIGREIQDPRIVQVFGGQLKKLRGG